MQLYRDHSIRFGGISAGDQELSAWYGTLPEREKDCVRFKQAICPQVRGTDIGQSIWRLRDHKEDTAGRFSVPCVMPKMKQWDYTEKRLYIGTELLLFQGFPITARYFRELSDRTPQRVQADLAGNAFASTVVMAVLSAVVFGSSWSTSSGANQVEETTATEAAEAMSLLKRAKRQRH